MYALHATSQTRSVTQTVVIVSRRKWFHQPVRFALSGGLSTAAHWLMMAIMVFAGATPLAATGTGAFVGAVVNYILQRNVTFNSSVAHRSALPRYLGVVTLTWFANFFIFLILHRVVLLSPMVAQGVTTLTVALLSYLLYMRIVFNDRQSQPV